MKQLLAFLKATLLGGALFVLPAWLAVLLVAKALTHLQVFVKPVTSHLPESIGHPRIIAVVLLLAICFVVGLVIRTTIGEHIQRFVEGRLLPERSSRPRSRGRGFPSTFVSHKVRRSHFTI
jgi:uncharacterized membrane protein